MSVSDTGGSPPNGSRLCDLLVTSPDALPLSYRPFSIFNYVEVPERDAENLCGILNLVYFDS